uniref:Gcp-like domain-containing protein n=1 Tax=Sinocyclocheilus anshuiensis TaxID=1608454 RepID=A0A671L2E4_9TELE
RRILDSSVSNGFIARRLSLRNHPECSSLSGGQELYDCNFSFAGLRNQVTLAISKKEREGVEKGQLLSCVKDIAAASQHTMASHIAKRTHRAILYCKSKGLLPQHNPTLLRGVASNEYIRRTLKIVTDATGLHLLCPSSKFCTDNGVMIAWNGIERLKQGKGIMSHCEEVNYEPKAPLGLDITSEVKDAAIKIPPLKLRINS